MARAGKLNLIPIAINVGSGLGLLAVVSIPGHSRLRSTKRQFGLVDGIHCRLWAYREDCIGWDAMMRAKVWLFTVFRQRLCATLLSSIVIAIGNFTSSINFGLLATLERNDGQQSASVFDAAASGVSPVNELELREAGPRSNMLTVDFLQVRENL